jgi:hypothetical protein
MMCRGLVLQQYKLAEEEFERVIQLDEDCEDAKQELEAVKIQQLVEMGFVEDQAFAAIQQYGTVQVWAFPSVLCMKMFSVHLALQSTVVTMCTACFNINELRILCIPYIYVVWCPVWDSSHPRHEGKSRAVTLGAIYRANMQ